MKKGHRSLLNWLLSGVSVSSAYLGLSLGTLLIGIMAFFALDQVESGIQIFVRQYQEETFKVFASSVFYLKHIVFASFACVSIFIYFFGKGVKAHILNQGYALEMQVDLILANQFHDRRQMRKHDELKNVMTKIQILADKLQNMRGQ